MDFTISPSLQVKMRSSLHTEFQEINVSCADLKKIYLHLWKLFKYVLYKVK